MELLRFYCIKHNLLIEKLLTDDGDTTYKSNLKKLVLIVCFSVYLNQFELTTMNSKSVIQALSKST